MTNKIRGIGEKTMHHLLILKVLIRDVSHGRFYIQRVVHHLVNEPPKWAVLLIAVLAESLVSNSAGVVFEREDRP